MNVSAGHLHSSRELLVLAESQRVSAASLDGQELRVLVSPAPEVVNLCTRCGWIEVDASGFLQLTPRGTAIRQIEDFQERLRQQLADLIAQLQPPWAKKIMHGRRELHRFAPDEITQCFDEAALFADDPPAIVIKWWDEMASLTRGVRSASLALVGREGEMLTRRFELQRTGHQPEWISLETSLAGYDVLSVVSASDSMQLAIEVKASSQRLADAFVFLTRHEWNTASNARAYCFHLWKLAAGGPQLAVIQYAEMELHVPFSRGDGQWETVKVPFSAFREVFRQVSL